LKYSAGTYVFVDIRPADTFAIADKLEVLALLGCASESCQDQAKGTLMVLPSTSCAEIVSSETFNATIRGSIAAAMLIQASTISFK
jgi:hypothetical protein